jgi:hypothetical protein
MFSKELGGRQHRIVPPARDGARRVRISFVSVSVKWHREENLNPADFVLGVRKSSIELDQFSRS